VFHVVGSQIRTGECALHDARDQSRVQSTMVPFGLSRQ
jgi:hypothetical protein